MKMFTHPTSGQKFMADFYIPRYRKDMIHYLREQGFNSKVGTMKQGQLCLLYIKIRIEKEGHSI